MLEQQQETLEESWNNIFTVFYTYYGSRNEALKGDAAQIYEVIASDSDVADEFIVRFVERDDWSLEEKLYLATAALEDFPGAAHLKLCVQMLDFCIDVPKYFNSLFYCIVRFSFMHGKNIEGFDDNTFKAEALWPRYNAFIERHFGDFEFPHQEPTANPERRAAFVTPQVLGLGHSTTRIALEYCRALAVNGGRTVLLANTELFPQQNEAPVNGAFIANRPPETADNIGRLDYEGCSFVYWRPNDIAFSVEKVKSAVLSIDAYCPSVVYSQGDWNMVADVLARKYPVVHVPSLRGQAMSHAHVYLHPVRGEERNNFEPLADQVGKYHPYTYMPIVPPTSDAPPERTSSIPKDAVVFAMAGNRLGAEIDDSFADVVASILSKNKKAHLAIVCPDYNGELNIKLSKKLARRVHKFGWQDDLGAFFKTCDVVLNPFRQGGAISAYLAMREGLPILSLGDCDVQNYIGRELCVADKEAYKEQALRLSTSPEARAKLSHRIKERVVEIPILAEVPEVLDAANEHACDVFAASRN